MEKKMIELTEEMMSQAVGGVNRTVNTGIDGMNAALRAGAGKGTRQIASIPNGTVVDTITDQLVYDPESGRHFVQVSYNGKIGWIASSLVGMKR